MQNKPTTKPPVRKGRWDVPFSRFLDDVFGVSDWRISEDVDWMPTVDVHETSDYYIIDMDLPGMDREDVSITYDDGMLKICGERKGETDEVEKVTFRRRERYQGSFCRTFRLPKDIKPEDIKANVKNGVLRLRIHKTEQKEPNEIPIDIQ